MEVDDDDVNALPPPPGNNIFNALPPGNNNNISAPPQQAKVLQPPHPNQTIELEDVYMRPVFNELQLPDKVSFVDLTQSGESTFFSGDSFSCGSGTDSQIIVVIDTCVLISKLNELREWKNRSTDEGVLLFLPWTVLQVIFVFIAVMSLPV